MRAVGVGAGGRRARRLLLLAGCLILGVLGLGAVEVHAATPSSLAGETFASHPVRGSTSTLTGACAITSGQEGSFSFSVSGTADGPFPGTFTESGSFTAPLSGFLDEFSSTFTITSTSGTVTGSKRLVPDTDATVRCSQLLDRVEVNTTDIPTTYTATINGTQRVTGTATVNMTGLVGGPPEAPTFSENFASTGVVQLTGKEQCKDGGWQSFGFKTQGDCVSFVATGGKNPPGGSVRIGRLPKRPRA
jgi:hypothetical protein